MDISFDEFFANIEYAMTGLARENGLHQTIEGVTAPSMLDANDQHLLENPVFGGQLSRAQEKTDTSAGVPTDKVDLGKALRQCEDDG